MPIIVNLDVMMAKRKMSLNELSESGSNFIKPFYFKRQEKQRLIRLAHWK
jgi:hypothetical protein